MNAFADGDAEHHSHLCTTVMLSALERTGSCAVWQALQSGDDSLRLGWAFSHHPDYPVISIKR